MREKYRCGTHRLLMVICAACQIAIANRSMAADGAAIKMELQDARSAYEKQISVADDKLKKSISAKITEVARAGKYEDAKSMKEEQARYEQDGIPPANKAFAAAAANHRSACRQAKVELRKAVEKAKSEYTKLEDFDAAGAMDKESKALEGEIAEFASQPAEKSQAKKRTPARDPLPNGSVWSGTLHQIFSGKKNEGHYDAKLTITERKGSGFKGRVEVNGGAFNVAGVLSRGGIRWEDLKKGHVYSGTLKGDAISAEFSGFSQALNTRTSGTLTLEKVSEGSADEKGFK